MKRLKLLFCIAAVFLAMLIASSRTINAQESQCVVKIEVPSEPVMEGDTFNVSVIAENIPDQAGGMYGWQIRIEWEPGLVNCTGEVINYNIWPQYMGPWITEPINNEEGYYEQSLNARDPSEPVTGTYWLVNLTFVANGEVFPSQVNFQLKPGYGLTYCLIDINTDEIPHTFSHGSVTIVPEFSNAIAIVLLLSATTVIVTIPKIWRRKT